MTNSSNEKPAENGAPGQYSGNPAGRYQRLRGSEVFVGGLQRNVTEGVIRELFSNCGEVAEIRIMKDHSGLAKGYCFVRFTTKDAASRAQMEKNGTMLQGKKIGVTPSTDQNTLFLGNLRKEWGQEDVDQMVRQALQDVQSVELAMPPSTGESPPSKKRQNRGFAFVHFASHAAAARAYRAASRPDFMLGGKWRPAVDWAENEPEPDPDEMAKVKTAFVGNLPSNVKEEFLRTLFGPFGKIERVAISRKSNIPVGFVHFAQRWELDAAIEGLDGKSIDGPSNGPKFKLQVSLAKPADKGRKRARDEMGGAGILASAPVSQFAAAVCPYDSLVPAGAYGDYTDYVVAKTPRVANKQFSLPEVVDPYELAVVSLRPRVADSLMQIFQQGIATRQEVDIRAVESLRDLPEQVAITALTAFSLSSFSGVPNKGAYLLHLVNRVRRTLRDQPGVGDSSRSAIRIPVVEPVNVRYDADVPRADAYGRVGPALAGGDFLLHRMANSVGDGYAPPYRLHSAAGPMDAVVVPGMRLHAGAGSMDAAVVMSVVDRRGFKFDPFTGEPYKYDPFTGEPLQTGHRIGSKHY